MDIIIPVYNEKENIKFVLSALQKHVRVPFRVLICYDCDDDNTLLAVNEFRTTANFEIDLIKNDGRGVHNAVRTGFRFCRSNAVLVYMADDDYNAEIINRMYLMVDKEGYDVVVASRFMDGGNTVGAPPIKLSVVKLASFTLHWLAHIPVKDATNGFRMFSKRVIDQIKIESRDGFTYSIELLVKCHRLGWKIGEVPVLWFERKNGKSKFLFLKWLPRYLRWYYYAFETVYLKKSKNSTEN